MVAKGVADDFLHVLIVSTDNEDLLATNYPFSDKGLEDIWRDAITDNTKFKLVDSQLIYKCIEKSTHYATLSQYLKTRYY